MPSEEQTREVLRKSRNKCFLVSPLPPPARHPPPQRDRESLLSWHKAEQPVRSWVMCCSFMCTDKPKLIMKLFILCWKQAKMVHPAVDWVATSSRGLKRGSRNPAVPQDTSVLEGGKRRWRVNIHFQSGSVQFFYAIMKGLQRKGTDHLIFAQGIHMGSWEATEGWRHTKPV